MKKIFALALLLFCTITNAQDIIGAWHGQLAFTGGQLRLDLNITKTESGYTATMDSPDQKAMGIPVTTITFESNTLNFAIPKGNLSYKGQLLDNAFKGTFTQNGMDIPLTLSRNEVTITKPKRPQEPAKPYPYYEEEVTFKNEKAGITLAGTLSLPKKEGSYPAVILVSGSGAQNRDEELLGHKPFLVLADYLTRHGIAVLRYDDRGTAASTGEYQNATTQDFATDANAAFNYLLSRKEINKNKIGIAGHSEGGVVAPMVAASNPKVAFIVLMAGTGIPGDELLLLQNFLINKAEGMPEEELNKMGAILKNAYDIIKQENNATAAHIKVKAVFNEQLRPLFLSKGIPVDQVNQLIEAQSADLTSAWYWNFIRYNPATALEKVKCPILAINGSNDLQVPARANLDAIKRATDKGGNKKVTIKELPGLNHLFQTSAKGAPSEYSEIEETFSPTALKEIADWIIKQTK
ncbi:alpha/beta fold hydrolase [Flavobacterium sp. Sd200]|uniref:alpha/beta hydrolase family protein n=1 Tax=Flavobacterium sp. Sd200 TaxID=2692211 RepID=UPI0013680DE5|nr:alpha/beta hydrolase [Flavobacterium sp. Sd200]MXN91557.1 alpha/beta fold hydrolase [Flavobacterium sp. Sd200]